MTVTITLTDPTADESRAVRAYLDALHSPTGERIHLQHTERAGVVEVRQTIYKEDEPEPDDTPTTAADAGAPDRDSAGLPWDERIHASSRATVADGTWRKKRGVADELVASVEAELRGAEPVEVASYTELPDDATGDQVAEAFANVAAPEVPEAPAPDSPPPPPAAPANPFLTVMSRIGKSKLDKARKDELLTAAGALDDNGKPSILVLNKKPELIDGFVALLDSEGV